MVEIRKALRDRRGDPYILQEMVATQREYLLESGDEKLAHSLKTAEATLGAIAVEKLVRAAMANGNVPRLSAAIVEAKEQSMADSTLLHKACGALRESALA